MTRVPMRDCQPVVRPGRGESVRGSLRWRRAGGIYLAVLSIAMVVAIIGGSALLLARNQIRATTMSESAVRADFLAQSAADLAIRTLSYTAWRTTLTNNTWSPLLTSSDGTLSLKVVDEIDGNLANDPNQPVRLYIRAVVGDAVRLYSAKLVPYAPPNLLANGDMEAGTANWTGQNCALSAQTDVPHGGTTYVYVWNRLLNTSGPIQTITSPLVNGNTYTFDAWVKMDVIARYVRPVLAITSSVDGTQYFTGANTLVGVSWTRITTNLVPSWNGSLLSAALYVGTSAGTTSFSIDDVRLSDANIPPLAPVAGSWRREVLP